VCAPQAGGVKLPFQEKCVLLACRDGRARQISLRARRVEKKIAEQLQRQLESYASVPRARPPLALAGLDEGRAQANTVYPKWIELSGSAAGEETAEAKLQRLLVGWQRRQARRVAHARLRVPA
jgi:hypothetical protein